MYVATLLFTFMSILNNFQTPAIAGESDEAYISDDKEAYSKVPPAAKNTNPRTTANTRPYNPNGRLNPV